MYKHISPGVCLVVKVACLGPESPEFKPLSTFELTPGVVEISAVRLFEYKRMCSTKSKTRRTCLLYYPDATLAQFN